ncbi:MAG: HD domain-containing phosphohydrolase [Gemmatimonadota bacterium]
MRRDQAIWSEAKLLVADDMKANVRLLRRILEREGYENVYEASDGRQALALAGEIEPDLMLLDLHMPDMDGQQVLEQLWPSVAPESYLPVVILTADANPEVRRRMLALGAMDFLTKPFDSAEVLLRVRNLLDTRALHLHMEEKVRERTISLQKANAEILDRLAQAAEFRDDETGLHTRRVGEVAARIARELGRPSAEVDLIRRTAPLHDVGKIGIPDTILLKPGRLTPEEYTVMKTHTTIGANILARGDSMLLAMAECIARFHHERWDATGYPDGLEGENIPLPARIVAVADFYDALSHDRVYRPAWSPEEVRSGIIEAAGEHFDSVVVDAFLKTLS